MAINLLAPLVPAVMVGSGTPCMGEGAIFENWVVGWNQQCPRSIAGWLVGVGDTCSVIQGRPEGDR